MAPALEDVPRRWLVRGILILLVVVLLTATVGLSLAYDPPSVQAGTIDRTANGTTVVAIQGFHLRGEDDPKKPARLIAFDENGSQEWIYNGSKRGAAWFYDVDPLPSGNLLVVSTEPGKTRFYELDPDTKTRKWEAELPIHDTHDAEYLGDGKLLVANMRNYDEETGISDDRLFIYDVENDTTTWEWYFKDHYPETMDGGMNEDWTHVNDVDRIGEDRYLVSPRNFDQVIVVNRSTDRIEMRLGRDDDHETLKEQHNPDYLESENGTPTMLVADSENDRVVEYARENGEWRKVWEVGGEKFNWPRDADRLPNGNTLIVDSLNHRVVEVTPEGRIVWEVYAPWAPYDVERPVHGQGSNGPTMRDLGVSGTYEPRSGADLTVGTSDEYTTFHEWLRQTFGSLPLVGSPIVAFADTWEKVSQWAKPVWMDPWGFVALLTALLMGLFWGIGEAVYHRRRIADGLRGAAGRVRR